MEPQKKSQKWIAFIGSLLIYIYIVGILMSLMMPNVTKVMAGYISADTKSFIFIFLTMLLAFSPFIVIQYLFKWFNPSKDQQKLTTILRSIFSVIALNFILGLVRLSETADIIDIGIVFLLTLSAFWVMM